MWKLNFYLLPAQKYNQINLSDILELGKVINAIEREDIFSVPEQFYLQPDEEGTTAADYLYGGRQTDMSTYLYETISKQTKICENSYEEIEKQSEKGYVIFLCNQVPEEKKEIVVRTAADIVKCRRYYIMKTKTYGQYIERIKKCFPDLFFHENAFSDIESLGDFKTVVAELHRHLVTLNDYGADIYVSCNKREETAFRVLDSKHKITCSGKGSKETKDFKVKCNNIKITCNPHTKFYNGNNNQRIYFCWGRDEIANHNIIIAKIGGHWP